MDIQKKISEVVEKLTTDKNLMEEFKKEPVKALEKVLGVDLPDDVAQKIIDGVKAKLTVEKVSDVAGAIKGLLNNK